MPGENAYEIAIADLDHDGRPDLGVTFVAAPTVSLFQNFSTQAALEFGSRVTLPGNASSIAFGDINRDGRIDVVTSENPYLSVYLNVMTLTPDPIATINQIIDALLAANLGRRFEQPLLASLQAAKASFENGGAAVAANQLNAFQNKLRSQVSPSQPDLAGNLSEMAQQIINSNSALQH